MAVTTIEKEKILEQYQKVRQRTVDLCEPLQTEDYIPQPVPNVSPAKWHLGHTTWFFEEFVLIPYFESYKRYHADFSFLFNSYYNLIGDRILRVDRGNMTRPTVQEVYAYRAYVDEAMQQLLSEKELSGSLEQTIEIGWNHEQQHQELLITDVKYILGHQPLFPVYQKDFSLVETKNTSTGWLEYEGGLTEIGADYHGFSYDNEHKRHSVFLAPFAIQRGLVTNGDFIRFIESGGYENPVFWLDEGWAWLNENNIKAPLYWHKIGDRWKYYTLSGLKEIDMGCQLSHISHYEAAAYAEWKGLRLPTEFEWEYAADDFTWGDRWEWTNSAYLPYPGFKKPAGAVGEYNGKFMVNQMVLRGSSTATSPGHSRKTYRNFFQSKYQWQCTGIRLAKNL